MLIQEALDNQITAYLKEPSKQHKVKDIVAVKEKIKKNAHDNSPMRRVLLDKITYYARDEYKGYFHQDKITNILIEEMADAMIDSDVAGDVLEDVISDLLDDYDHIHVKQ